MQKTKHRYEISRNCTGDPFCYGDFRLHQVGRIHMHPKGRIAEHLQRDYYELTIAEDGKGWVYTDSVAVPIRKGDIYLSFAGDFHAIESDEEDPLKFGFITVSTSLPALSAPLEGIMAENHAANARLFSEKRVSDIAARILSELAEDTRSLSEKYVESLICELLILLIRAFERKTPPAAHGGASSERGRGVGRKRASFLPLNALYRQPHLFLAFSYRACGAHRLYLQLPIKRLPKHNGRDTLSLL